MQPPIAIYIPPIHNSGLPLWQEIPLTILGCALGLGLVWCVVALVRLPGERRVRRRAREVRAAAGTTPPYSPSVVHEASARLFREVDEAWSAGDRERLRALSDPDLMADWEKRMERYAAAGGRYRGEILKGPRLEYLSLLADRGLVRLRVRAKVRRWLELPDGKRRSLPDYKGRQQIRLEQFWTLSLSGGTWIAFATRGIGSRAEYMAEPIVPVAAAPAPTAPIPTAHNHASETAAAVDRAAYGEVAAELERNLRAFGAWEQPPPQGPVRGAFGAPDLVFSQWLEHILCPRLRAVAAGIQDPPARSSVSAMAVREFDGNAAAAPVIHTLLKLDNLVES